MRSTTGDLRYSDSGMSPSTTSMMPPAEPWSQLPRTPFGRSSTSQNTPSETVWKIAEGPPRVLHRRLEAADRAPSNPLGRLQNPYFGIHPDFPNSFSTHSG